MRQGTELMPFCFTNNTVSNFTCTLSWKLCPTLMLYALCCDQCKCTRAKSTHRILMKLTAMWLLKPQTLKNLPTLTPATAATFTLPLCDFLLLALVTVLTKLFFKHTWHLTHSHLWFYLLCWSKFAGCSSRVTLKRE